MEVGVKVAEVEVEGGGKEIECLYSIGMRYEAFLFTVCHLSAGDVRATQPFRRCGRSAMPASASALTKASQESEWRHSYDSAMDPSHLVITLGDPPHRPHTPEALPVHAALEILHRLNEIVITTVDPARSNTLQELVHLLRRNRADSAVQLPVLLLARLAAVLTIVAASAYHEVAVVLAIVRFLRATSGANVVRMDSREPQLLVRRRADDLRYHLTAWQLRLDDFLASDVRRGGLGVGDYLAGHGRVHVLVSEVVWRTVLVGVDGFLELGTSDRTEGQESAGFP